MKPVHQSAGPGDVGAGKRSTKIEDDAAEALHPNLLMIGRDKAHAFRRVLQRPYQADDYLHNLMTDHVLGSHSMVQIVANSFEFRLWLEEEIKKQTDTTGFGAQCRNLKAAKHRFESHSTPLGRTLLYLPAWLATCSRVRENRHGKKEGQQAQDYLRALNPEALIQLSMLADAADEGLMLVRAMDRENVDMSEIASSTAAFMDRVGVLFQQGKVVECGYTDYVLNLLRQGSLCILLPNATKKFKGVDEAVVGRCLDRMRCWTRLAVEVVRTEYPHHSLFNAMQVFALRLERDQASELGEAANEHFHRLAQVFGVNATALRDQLLRHRPVAEQVLREGGLRSRDAWLGAMRRMKAAGSPSDHLSPVLWRYIAWQAG